ncbi:MAG: AraC family transcriptional regulator ligand-binding domain-containing protein [Beijerinckiaceae bacterium]|nr:AraC family transcriptional regulator ligand-binding domain-containing protein [Beijerinckiaceae bacterium]
MSANACPIEQRQSRIGAGILLLQRLAERRVNLASFLAYNGLDAALFEDPDNTIPFAKNVQLYKAAAQATGCDGIAALTGLSAGFSQLGPLGVEMRKAASVFAALKIAENAFCLQASGAKLIITAANDAIDINYIIIDSNITTAGHISSGVLSYVCSVMIEMCGPKCRPIFVALPLKAPLDKGPFIEAFCKNIQFNSHRALVRFDAKWMNRAPINLILGPNLTAPFVCDDGLLAAVKIKCIQTSLAGSLPTIPVIAKTLGLSERTLSRRLGEFGTNFQDIRQVSAFDASIQLLNDTDLSVTNIALALGYSEVAAFTRAFRLWAGYPPNEVRQRSQI